ncbi:MAG: protein-glutamate O-methyltransferase CheR [Anaeromyxobacteraceae bacterium]
MSGPLALSDLDFTLFQALIERETGIFLPQVKAPFLTGRLDRRVRELGLASYRDYLDLCQRDVDERTRLLEAIATHETSFFREPKQWALLESDVFPRWRTEVAQGRRPPKARLWSTACATGEEAWSLAMALLAAFPPGCLPGGASWDLAILATDFSSKALARAREGRYPALKKPQIPPEKLLLHWDEDADGALVARDSLRRLVHFDRVNLIRGGWPIPQFDLIFCRNVLIYFEPDVRAKVVDRLLGKLEPDGYLFLGGAESAGKAAAKVRTIIPSVYAPLHPAGEGA